MTPSVIALAGVFGFLLAALAASLFCLARVRMILHALPRTSASEAALEAVQRKLEALERELRELPALAAVSATPGLAAAPRAALNLEKRSHALRLHRRGESSSRIASALELPQQEVELLIKVHRIVLKNL